MTMDGVPGLVALLVVSLATLAIGTYGLRISRTTSDFYVASRSVAPGLNASAIGGEYLSAASYLGVAALVLTAGAQMLWYPIGWTAGYLVLLVLVAAPLRRSGAYTLPDFAEARLGSRRVRALCSVLVVAIGWLYLLPQFQGAGLTLTAAVDAPTWVGALVVGAVVVVNVSSGGMRSITFVQAFQYWLKLTALLVPAAVLLVVWAGDGRPDPTGGGAGWSMPLGEGNQGLYTTYSIVLATFLGTMGLPHVVVRFYTNPDGGAARRTTLTVLALLGVFYLLPPIYAVLGRAYGAEADDTVVLELPRLMLDGPSGDLLTGVVTAGAFAAFLSTSSGLAIAVSGVIAQDVLGGRLSGRLGVPGRRHLRGRRTARGRGARPRPVGGPGGRVGVRRRRVDVLSPAGARHLVARPHPGGRGRGAAHRRAGRRRRRRLDAVRRGAGELARRAARPAGGLERAAGVRGDGRRLAGHPRRRARPREPVHGPAAHTRGRPARPWLTPVRRGGRVINQADESNSTPLVRLGCGDGRVQGLERARSAPSASRSASRPAGEAHTGHERVGVVRVRTEADRLVAPRSRSTSTSPAPPSRLAHLVGVGEPERAGRSHGWLPGACGRPRARAVAPRASRCAPVSRHASRPHPAAGAKRAGEVAERAGRVTEEHGAEAADQRRRTLPRAKGMHLRVRPFVGRVA